MSDKTDDVTVTNEAAKDKFNGKPTPTEKRPEDAQSVTEVNEAADAEFNDAGEKSQIGNQVGGLRGSSD